MKLFVVLDQGSAHLFGQPKQNGASHGRPRDHNVHEIRLEETDKLARLGSHYGCAARMVIEQGELAELVYNFITAEDQAPEEVEE